MRIYYPSLRCYPASCPSLSDLLLEMLAASAGEWRTATDLYPFFTEFRMFRVRNALINLHALGFLRRDRRGYQLAIPEDEARSLFACKITPTQHQVINVILSNGFVYARQFQLAGKGDATQFLRAVRSLEAAGILESTTEGVPNVPHIQRRIYTFTRRARKHD